MVVALAVLAGCASCRSDGPCLHWIDVHQTYSVKALKRFEPKGEAWSDVPYAEFMIHDSSCGAALGDDLDGGTLKLEAVRLLRNESGGCVDVAAKTALPGKFVAEASPPRRQLAPFRQNAILVTENGCKGEYEIGIVPASDRFLRAHEDVPSDYMLVRAFFPTEDTAACRDMLKPSDWCSDSWYVRVRDLSGHAISRDLAAIDAGP
jgi:hypothetical protein